VAGSGKTKTRRLNPRPLALPDAKHLAGSRIGERIDVMADLLDNRYGKLVPVAPNIPLALESLPLDYSRLAKEVLARQ
jgi:hypothetical protein